MSLHCLCIRVDCFVLVKIQTVGMMILYMGSWEEKIMPQNEFLSSLNIGSKYYKHLKISLLKLYII